MTDIFESTALFIHYIIINIIIILFLKLTHSKFEFGNNVDYADYRHTSKENIRNDHRIQML